MKCKTVLIIFLILICIIVFCISSYIILKDFQEMSENNNYTENLIEGTIQVDDNTNEKSIDWNYLSTINTDIIAWIEIPDTKINYPILKDDNLFYLKHSFNKVYNSNGSIFTTNKNPFEDEETIVYGHNMKNGSMFSSLDKYMNKDFFYTHKNLKIYTPSCNYEGIIFSAYSTGIEAENNKVKSLNLNDRISYYKEMSKFTSETDENITKIVKLSTCSYINAKSSPTDQRYYIIAYLVEI